MAPQPLNDNFVSLSEPTNAGFPPEPLRMCFGPQQAEGSAPSNDDRHDEWTSSFPLDGSSSSKYAEFFAEDDTILQLELSRNQEIDSLVDRGRLSKEERWKLDRREIVRFSYPEMILDIKTGRYYSVESLAYEVRNHSLPRVVID